jgi:polar amino acid transport system substrate-binding protein
MQLIIRAIGTTRRVTKKSILATAIGVSLSLTTWLIAVLALFGMVSSSLAAAPIFRVVCMDTENTPRILGDGTSIDWSRPGITLELLKMVEKKVGIQFQFNRMPWKRCLYMVKNGLADGTFHASYNPERAKYGVYPMRDGKLNSTRAIYTNTYSLFVKKGSGVTWNGKTLGNVSRPIGTQLSYAIAEDLRKMGYDVEEESSATSNLEKLVAGRISAYADMDTIVENTLREYGQKYAAVETLSPPLNEKVYYLLISNKFYAAHPEVSERIWNAVRDVQKTDVYREMLRKYEN